MRSSHLRRAIVAAVGLSCAVGVVAPTSASTGDGTASDQPALATRPALPDRPAARTAPSAHPPGSIVFIRRHDVWLARGDGSGQYQVTRDGTAARPYRSPSQSDTGTIAVGHGKDIVRMTQNGTVLNRIDPPPLVGPATTPAADVAISPNGRLIAYSLAAHQCQLGQPGCRPSVASGITLADRLIPATTYGITTYWSPSWVGNSRVLQSGGYLYQVMLKDLARPAVHWFDDQDLSNVPPGASTDLDDAELSPDGRRLAAVRGWGETTRITWYDVHGDARSGPPPGPPTWTCMTSALQGLASPTWAPDSLHLAWQEPDGIWSTVGTTPCADPRRIIADAGQPDWSAAPLAPAPRRLTPTRRPRVAGAAKVGRRLTVRSARFSPAPSTVRYRWLRNGEPIAKATKARYRLTKKDRGRRIAVRVTAQRGGYAAVTVTSKATTKVRR